MPRKTPEIAISPAVLEWARISAGFSYDDVARRLGISIEKILTWGKEHEPVHLRVRQLEDLAHYFKRPMAALLLLEPPDEPNPPRDFRRAVHRDAPLSPSIRLAIRRARRLQRVTCEVMEEMELSPFSDIPQINVQQQPEMVAKAQREACGISVKEQLEWRSHYEAFRRWREVLEARKILTFQGDFPREEAQGFSLSEGHPYVIMVSSDDPPTARCFTLFHELGHLLLRQGGVCVTELAYSQPLDDLAETESWCHQFAEAFLIDGDVLRSKKETEAIIRRQPNYQQSIRSLAFSFKVSPAVLLFRLWHSELISEDRFWAEFTRLQKTAQAEAERRKPKKQGKGGPSPAQKCIQERGRFLTRLIVEALDRQILGYTEAADYLGIRLKHLDKVRQSAHD
ncbi:MAG: ImmA/IrrE family metallo-endopeptidase [Chloroflexi bacterium]|nr:ImmA/IrrE family metallo-endopeptidase [Chloroflexota bacterium]